MKKFIAIVICVISLLCLTACKKFTCGLCYEEKTGGHEIDMFGKTYTICDECYDGLNMLSEELLG